jgi:hypothetical protein
MPTWQEEHQIVSPEYMLSKDIVIGEFSFPHNDILDSVVSVATCYGLESLGIKFPNLLYDGYQLCSHE